MTPRRSPLKVFRTTIGFHDAYVAAPSRKAALEAWGAETDLFSAKMAEQVTDPDLMAEPLAHPGTTIRKARGTLAEHLAAATPAEVSKRDKPRPKPSRDKTPRNTIQTKTAPADAEPRPKAKRLPPRPNRTELDRAEEERKAFEVEMERDLQQLRDRELQIRDERDVLRRKQREGRVQIDKRIAAARDRYNKAEQLWQAAISDREDAK